MGRWTDADTMIREDSNCLCRQGPLKNVPLLCVWEGERLVTASGPLSQKISSFMQGTLASLNLISCAHFTDTPNAAPREAEASTPGACGLVSLQGQGAGPIPGVEERRGPGGPGGCVSEAAHDRTGALCSQSAFLQDVPRAEPELGRETSV